jgi:hypothetical protein
LESIPVLVYRGFANLGSLVSHKLESIPILVYRGFANLGSLVFHISESISVLVYRVKRLSTAQRALTFQVFPSIIKFLHLDSPFGKRYLPSPPSSDNLQTVPQPDNLKNVKQKVGLCPARGVPSKYALAYGLVEKAIV